MPASRTQSPHAIAFGAIIRRLRLAKHWTYRDLARASGMHPTYLSILENGGNEPKVSTLILLADVFGVDAKSILGEMIEHRAMVIPAKQAKELDRRLAAHESNPGEGPTWEEIHRRLRKPR